MSSERSRTRFWVEMALECIRRDHTGELSSGDQTGPFLTARSLGMALGALYDCKAIAAGRDGLLGIGSQTKELSQLSTAEQEDLAACGACHQVLRNRYAKQTTMLDSAWKHWLHLYDLNSESSEAEKTGRLYGDAVLQRGANDKVIAGAAVYVPSGKPYTHKAPPNQPNQGFAGAGWGAATPLAAKRISNFPAPPTRNDPNSATERAHYSQDFALVAAKGAIESQDSVSGGRREAEEVIGIAWGYDGPKDIGTPPRLYMQVILTVLDNLSTNTGSSLSVLDELAVIGGAAIAMADAGIDAWHYKYAPTHMMWRPAVGITEASTSDGITDPDWRPLGRPDTNGLNTSLTPDFPAYPSGHATFGGAAFQLLRLFLVDRKINSFDVAGVDDVAFAFVSDEYNGRNKDPRTGLPRDRVILNHNSLWEAMVNNSISRVFLGVHWQFDGITTRNSTDTQDEFGVPKSPSQMGRTGGVWLGAQIANQIAGLLKVSNQTIKDSGIT